MHLLMMLLALGLAWLLRLAWQPATGNWSQRWQRALLFFLLPPLLLLMTAVAVLCMGSQGEMIGLRTGWLSYWLVFAGVGISLVCCLQLAVAGWQSWRQVRSYPRIVLGSREWGMGNGEWGIGSTARLLENPTLFIAQIGFWQPELVVSQGLLQALTPEHLAAVLTHEEAHRYYRDTFWFFWLGWVRHFSVWLPNTEVLWQELLLLREIRADGWAAQRVDALLLAESLLMVVSASVRGAENFCAAFSCTVPRNRLQERIDALLGEIDYFAPSSIWTWSWLTLVLLPLLAVPFHG
ncbi:MAG: M56 family metallopeptidase [Symploca sp. SIO2E6]|nr:M56 family metallopeptidase [Symploca sp. SIO2E6]